MSDDDWLGDASSEGPEAPDPAAELRVDEEDLAPSVDVPSVDIPTVDADADPATARAFWTTVVLVNAGLLFVSLGPMLAYFEGRVTIGAALVGVGVLSFGRAYLRYRRYMAAGETDDESPESDSDGSEPEEDNA